MQRKRMELCRSLYNAELGRVEHRYHAMQHDPRYRHYRDVIDSVYEQDAKSRAKTKQTPEYKAATRLQNDLFKEYGFTSYTFLQYMVDELDYIEEVRKVSVIEQETVAA